MKRFWWGVGAFFTTMFCMAVFYSVVFGIARAASLGWNR